MRKNIAIKNNLPPIVIAKEDRVKYFEYIRNDDIIGLAKWFEELSINEELESIGNDSLLDKQSSKKRGKKGLTIYEHFENLGYTKEQVNEFIPELTETQLKNVLERNGGDLENPKYIKIISLHCLPYSLKACKVFASPYFFIKSLSCSKAS